MFVTEKQAAQKWCPMRRVEVPSGHKCYSQGNTMVVEVQLREQSACIASRCMMWRLAPGVAIPTVVCDDPTATTEPAQRPRAVKSDWMWHPYDGTEPAHWAEPEHAARSRFVGYCGLAGFPRE